MNEIVVRKVSNFHGYDYIVYPTTFINPLLKKSVLNENIKKEIKGPGHILFDLLLCNGDCANRFFEAYFNGEKIDKKSLESVKFQSSNDVKYIENYYSENPKVLKNGNLVSSEYLKHC